LLANTKHSFLRPNLTHGRLHLPKFEAAVLGLILASNLVAEKVCLWYWQQITSALQQ
jgi:hypothetical protein